MQSNIKIKLSIVAGLITVITLAHYSTDVSIHNMHHVYRRLYYIPIILTSFWFGFRGGIFCSLSISAIYIPHLLFQHHAAFFAQLNIYLEIVMFNIIGLITGILSSAQMKENTKKMELERRLERTIRLSALGEMAAGIAHEIRNPLYSIKGTAEIISEGFKPNDKKYDMAGIMITEIDRLNDLVNNFLQFAKPKEPTFIEADLNDLIRKSLEIVKFRY
ncbi:MAG: histidine kinase dimerization/phospho-acceptor domain-containing protein, partial [Candidatus Anammoxibacter sp.]